MKFITLTLALLGVVGALRLNQVPVPAMDSLSLIFAQDNSVLEKTLFDAIEASPNKSITPDEMHKALIALVKKYHIKIPADYLEKISN